jgi:hypothetical protein
VMRASLPGAGMRPRDAVRFSISPSRTDPQNAGRAEAGKLRQRLNRRGKKYF